MQVKARSSSVTAIRAAALREPCRPLRIEELEMGGPRENELLVRCRPVVSATPTLTFAASAGSGRRFWAMKGRRN
jgi:hypothetical protein